MRGPSKSVLLAAVEAAERTTGEISSVLHVSPSAVSRRLLALEGVGVVRRRKVSSARSVWELAELPQSPRSRA